MMMMTMMIVESKSVSHGGRRENRRGVGGIVHHSLSAHHPVYLSPDGRTQRPAAVRHIQLVLPRLRFAGGVLRSTGHHGG